MIFSRRLLRPLSRLDDAVRGLAAGQLDAKLVGPEEGDEIGLMAAGVMARVTHLATQ